MSLEHVLECENLSEQLPEWLKGKYKSLCIIPDHWFGNQNYPFKSKKASLIDPFLERKLAAAYPNQEAIRHFFNYRHVGHNKDQELLALFFQEDKSYELYATLVKLNHTPSLITAPAYLWEDYLHHTDADFSTQGILLVHHEGQECHLYFYFNGNYQFSRIVGLGGTENDLDALGFEINQSLYMFSQKTKSELDRIFMLCEATHCREKLGEALGRDITDLRSLPGHRFAVTPGVDTETLNGLLQIPHLNSNTNFFGVTHRQIKKEMEWWPVQWVGIIIGLILLLGLAAEHLLIHNMLKQARDMYQAVQQHMATKTSTVELMEHSTTLDRVLEMTKRTELAHAAHRIPTFFPAGIQLKSLYFRSEGLTTVNMTAWVQARNAEELQTLLSRLLIRIKDNFENTNAMTLSDIDINLDQNDNRKISNRYRITFQLELI